MVCFMGLGLRKEFCANGVAMKQEERNPNASDYILKLFEMYESGKVTGIKIQVDAALNNEEVTALQKENEQLKAELANKDAVRLWNENEKLKAKLEKAKKALEYYSNIDSWDCENLHENKCIKDDDMELLELTYDGTDFSDWYGGKRARQALKDLEGEV